MLARSLAEAKGTGKLELFGSADLQRLVYQVFGSQPCLGVALSPSCAAKQLLAKVNAEPPTHDYQQAAANVQGDYVRHRPGKTFTGTGPCRSC